ARTELIRHLWFWGKGLICIVLILVILFLVQTQWLSRQQNSYHPDASTKIHLPEKIDQTLRAADKINLQMQDLELKSGMLATLTKHQFFYDILAVLADSFNDGTWIDNLLIQRGKDKDTDMSSISVQGFSMTHNSLGAFLESLSDIERVKDVVLVYAKSQDQNSQDQDSSNAVEFKLTCSIVKVLSK
ncbi:MAG: PilN domain-containing protein, partial [Desulfobacula sp.]|nr:PilN domain-containing protein [Desulfobacula sp.]